MRFAQLLSNTEEENEKKIMYSGWKLCNYIGDDKKLQKTVRVQKTKLIKKADFLFVLYKWTDTIRPTGKLKASSQEIIQVSAFFQQCSNTRKLVMQLWEC